MRSERSEDHGSQEHVTVGIILAMATFWRGTSWVGGFFVRGVIFV